jgi:hypothetical protein
MIPLDGLSKKDQLVALENDIRNGDSPELALMLHGITAGELNLVPDEVMPKDLNSAQATDWRRHFECGRLCRDPQTAKLPANPALAEAALKKRREPRPFELDLDLIGGGKE